MTEIVKESRVSRRGFITAVLGGAIVLPFTGDVVYRTIKGQDQFTYHTKKYTEIYVDPNTHRDINSERIGNNESISSEQSVNPSSLGSTTGVYTHEYGIPDSRSDLDLVGTVMGGLTVISGIIVQMHDNIQHNYEETNQAPMTKI